MRGGGLRLPGISLRIAVPPPCDVLLPAPPFFFLAGSKSLTKYGMLDWILDWTLVFLQNGVVLVLQVTAPPWHTTGKTVVETFKGVA